MDFAEVGRERADFRDRTPMQSDRAVNLRREKTGGVILRATYIDRFRRPHSLSVFYDRTTMALVNVRGRS